MRRGEDFGRGHKVDLPSGRVKGKDVSSGVVVDGHSASDGDQRLKRISKSVHPRPEAKFPVYAYPQVCSVRGERVQGRGTWELPLYDGCRGAEGYGED